MRSANHLGDGSLRRVPGLVEATIFAFTLSWNEVLYALVVIQHETTLTVPVGLNGMVQTTPW